MRELILHTVNLTPEAVFDYEHCLLMRERTTCENCTAKCGGDWNKPCPREAPTLVMPKAEYKRELEEYIQRSDYLKYRHYFRCKYLDENTGVMLMLFILRRQKLGYKQFWDVVGIMPADEWDEEKEEEGVYRSWYNGRITNTADYDWIEEYRLKQELSAIEQKLEEVYKSEFKQSKRAEHDRRFDKKNVARSQNKLDEIISTREELESRRRVLKSKLKAFASAARVFR